MSGNGFNQPQKGSAQQSSDFHSFCFNFLALQATRDACRQNGNLGTQGAHPAREALPNRNLADSVPEGNGLGCAQPFGQPPSMWALQNAQAFTSMISTVQTLESLAWQLLYGSKTIVFDESRWQECFRAFNAMAMQSTSLITILSKKYEVRIRYIALVT